jgi:hypothetical protein
MAKGATSKDKKNAVDKKSGEKGKGNAEEMTNKGGKVWTYCE